MARLERKPAERVAIAGVIVQALCGVLALVFWRYSGAISASVLAWQALIGIPVGIAALMHMRQSRMAEEEQEEWERLQAERAAGGAHGRLFEEDEIQAFSSRNRMRIFEKYISPLFAVIVSLSMAAVVISFILMNLVPQAKVNYDRTLISIASFAAMAFVTFLIGTYQAGMARQTEWRPLRAAASFMMFTTLLSFMTVVALLMGFFKFAIPDRVIAYVMLALMALIAVEVLLNFVLDFYRPRLEGVEPRAAYDSRLLGLLTQPSGILRTVASTLDYQFGFKVSHTWFYRFIEQAIAPLVLFQLLTLYLLTCFVIVGPEQMGVLERMGRFQKVVEPGLHVKWPWPIEHVYRFSANEVKTITLGHAGGRISNERSTWTEKHYDTEFEVMVATRDVAAGEGHVPVNLLVASTTVRYKIADVQKWYYSSAAPEAMLEALCNRELNRYLATVDLLDIMGPGRQAGAEHLREVMQQAAARADLGVNILGVGLEEMHPPVANEVPQAFHELIAAVTDKEVKKLDAEKDEIEMLGKARGDAEVRKLQARSYYANRVKLAEAEAKRLEVQSRAYADAAEVFKQREFLSALEKAYVDARKYILAVKGLGSEHIRLNLEDAGRPDVLDIPDFNKPVVD